MFILSHRITDGRHKLQNKAEYYVTVDVTTLATFILYLPCVPYTFALYIRPIHSPYTFALYIRWCLCYHYYLIGLSPVHDTASYDIYGLDCMVIHYIPEKRKFSGILCFRQQRSRRRRRRRTAAAAVRRRIIASFRC